MHVLIVGLGNTGRRLATQLLQQGHQVTGVSRHAQYIDGVAHWAQDVLMANYTQLAPIDWVYILLTPSERSVEGYQRIFLHSILPLTTALRMHPIQKIIFISSTSVYGQQQGEWVDEDSEATPITATAQVLRQAEQAWQAAWGDVVTVVRPSGIYAAHRQRLIEWVKQAKPVRLNHWSNRIHVDDLAGLLAQMTRCASLSELYIATDGVPALQHEVLDGIAEHLQYEKLPKIAANVSGKRLKSKKIGEIGYIFRYASWQVGYFYG